MLESIQKRACQLCKILVCLSFTVSIPVYSQTSSLSLLVERATASGEVSINGFDTRRPQQPFTFSWGDGTSSSGFFPQTHTYLDPWGTYEVGVSQTYTDGFSDTKKINVGLPNPIDSMSIESLSPTGLVKLVGTDIRVENTDVSFSWGDGTITQGTFPQEHTYMDPWGKIFKIVISSANPTSNAYFGTVEVEFPTLAEHLKIDSLTRATFDGKARALAAPCTGVVIDGINRGYWQLIFQFQSDENLKLSENSDLVNIGNLMPEGCRADSLVVDFVNNSMEATYSTNNLALSSDIDSSGQVPSLVNLYQVKLALDPNKLNDGLFFDIAFAGPRQNSPPTWGSEFTRNGFDSDLDLYILPENIGGNEKALKLKLELPSGALDPEADLIEYQVLNEAGSILSSGTAEEEVEIDLSLSFSSGIANLKIVAVDEFGLASEPIFTTVRAKEKVPTPPFKFINDADWITSNRSSLTKIEDSYQRIMPNSIFEFYVRTYGTLSRTLPFPIDVSPEGVVSTANPTTRFAESYSIVAESTYGNVDGIKLIVSSQNEKELTVVETTNWRLVVPLTWIERMDSVLPDWREALDIGWQAQKELMGLTSEGAEILLNPGNIPNGALILPQSSATIDPAVCGLSTVPITFGEDCFIFSSGELRDHPRWFIIFHEMGHNSNLRQFGRALYCDIFCGSRSATWVEGDASVLAMWSSRRMSEAPSISTITKQSIIKSLEGDMSLWKGQLATWVEGNEAFSDNNDFSGFHAGPWDGIHVLLIEEFGWDYIPRYAKSWRMDETILQLVGSENTTVSRATFAAAAVSAALGRDTLLTRFEEEWRFPIDRPLFSQLYARFLETMNEPWD